MVVPPECLAYNKSGFNTIQRRKEENGDTTYDFVNKIYVDGVPNADVMLHTVIYGKLDNGSTVSVDYVCAIYDNGDDFSYSFKHEICKIIYGRLDKKNLLVQINHSDFQNSHERLDNSTLKLLDLHNNLVNNNDSDVAVIMNYNNIGSNYLEYADTTTIETDVNTIEPTLSNSQFVTINASEIKQSVLDFDPNTADSEIKIRSRRYINVVGSVTLRGLRSKRNMLNDNYFSEDDDNYDYEDNENVNNKKYELNTVGWAVMEEVGKETMKNFWEMSTKHLNDSLLSKTYIGERFNELINMFSNIKYQYRLIMHETLVEIVSSPSSLSSPEKTDNKWWFDIIMKKLFAPSAHGRRYDIITHTQWVDVYTFLLTCRKNVLQRKHNYINAISELAGMAVGVMVKYGRDTKDSQHMIAKCLLMKSEFNTIECLSSNINNIDGLEEGSVLMALFAQIIDKLHKISVEKILNNGLSKAIQDMDEINGGRYKRRHRYNPRDLNPTYLNFASFDPAEVRYNRLDEIRKRRMKQST